MAPTARCAACRKKPPRFQAFGPNGPGLTPLPLAEKDGLVWVIPTAAPDRAATFDIAPWLGGLGPELASYGFGAYHIFERRAVNEEMNWKILVDTFHESYHIGFLHKDSLTGILHTNAGDFEPFGPSFRLAFARSKIGRLKDQPEEKWDLMWNTSIVYSLFANTLLVVQGDHIETHRVFPAENRVDRALMETALYTPEARDHGRGAGALGHKNIRSGDAGGYDRGLSGWPHDADRLRLRRADASRLRPQRAGTDPLSPVDPACDRAASGRRRQGRSRVAITRR